MNAKLKLAAEYSRMLLPLLILGVFLIGCQSAMLGYQGRSVPGHEQIVLEEGGPHYGNWRTRDLTVDYQYARNPNRMDLSGAVHFADYLRYGFQTIDYFRMRVLLLDAQGTVLGSKGIAIIGNYGDTEDSLKFTDTLMLPPGTAAMAFSYDGNARGSSGDEGKSDTSFWHYPFGY